MPDAAEIGRFGSADILAEPNKSPMSGSERSEEGGVEDASFMSNIGPVPHMSQSVRTFGNVL